MAIEWREFEKLVARIEQTLAPQGAVVKSPDHVKDLYTGQEREVDTTIRFRVGTVPILITVECRKRDRVQDDTWLAGIIHSRSLCGHPIAAQPKCNLERHAAASKGAPPPFPQTA